jgi:hypothetical protein
MQVEAMPPDDGLLQVASAPGGGVAVLERITRVLRAGYGGVERGDRGLEHVAVDWVDAEPLELLSFCGRAAVHGSQPPEQLPGVDLLRMASAASSNRALRPSRVPQASRRTPFDGDRTSCARGAAATWASSMRAAHRGFLDAEREVHPWRDGETYWSYLPGELGPHGIFLARVSDAAAAFCCTVQQDDLTRKFLTMRGRS